MSVVFDEKSFQEKTGVPRETLENLRIYAGLLKKWQNKINLVSSTTLPDLWSRHFYDSFQLKPHFDLSKAQKLRILDIGSGAGFPGLLLSMLGVGEFHMVESNNKKCAFMRQVIRDTKCRAVVHNVRAENLTAFHVDYIISRACAPLGKLLSLGHNFIHDDVVCLFLKGQTAEQEIVGAREKRAFEVEKFTSMTEESAMLLKVSHIKALGPVE